MANTWYNDATTHFHTFRNGDKTMTFTTENTQGYSQRELDQINVEWQIVVEREGLTEDSPAWKSRQERLLREWDQINTMSERITLSETARKNIELAHSYNPDEIEESLNGGDYGTLTEYDTSDDVRPATLDEAVESLEASPTGAFSIDGKTYYVAW